MRLYINYLLSKLKSLTCPIFSKYIKIHDLKQSVSCYKTGQISACCWCRLYCTSHYTTVPDECRLYHIQPITRVSMLRFLMHTWCVCVCVIFTTYIMYINPPPINYTHNSVYMFSSYLLPKVYLDKPSSTATCNLSVIY